jgi:hypothetical protein
MMLANLQVGVNDHPFCLISLRYSVLQLEFFPSPPYIIRIAKVD